MSFTISIKVYQKNIFLDVPKYDFCRFIDVVNNKLCLLPVYEDDTIYFSDGKKIVVNDKGMWGRKGLETIAVNSIVKESGMWDLKKYIAMIETEVDSS